MARIIKTRRSAGGVVCAFRGKGGHNTRSYTKPHSSTKDGVKEVFNQTHEPKPNASITMMTNKDVPSNSKMKQIKGNMEDITKRLSSLKVSKPKNISFAL